MKNKFILTKKIKIQKSISIKSIDWFTEKLWNELTRIDSCNKIVGTTVTCTEENINNLYGSQFAESTVYGEIYKYTQEGD